MSTGSARKQERQKNNYKSLIKGTKAKGSSSQKDPLTIKMIKAPQVMVKSSVAVYFKLPESLKLNFVKQITMTLFNEKLEHFFRFRFPTHKRAKK